MRTPGRSRPRLRARNESSSCDPPELKSGPRWLEATGFGARLLAARTQVDDPKAVLLGEPLGDQRAVTGLGVAFDAEERRDARQLGDQRIEVGRLEDLVQVALAVLGRELGA